jgi:hypothetical protein
MMRTLLLILLVALVSGQQVIKAQSAQAGIKFGEISTKTLTEQPDSDGDIWFSIKIEVLNEGRTDREVSFRIRGLDAEGFEVTDAKLEGRVKAGQRRDLTESTYVNYKAYKTIVKWEVEE